MTSKPTSNPGLPANPGRHILPLALATAAFAPLIEGGTTQLPVFILRMLVAALLAACLLYGIRQGSLELRRTPVDVPVAIFIVVAIVSTSIAPYKYMALTWLQSILFYAVFFYLAREAVAGPGNTAWAVLLVLGIGAVESLWGIAQWLLEGGRANGSFFNPNMLAVYVVPAAAMAVSLLLNRHRWTARPLAVAGLAGVAALSTAAVLLTGSRGGAAVLLAALFLVTWLRSRRAAVVLAAAVLAAVVLAPGLMEPVKVRDLAKDPYAYSRTGIWASSARMALDHPLGVGLGNFKYYWPRYNFPVEGAVIKYGKQAATAHNEYLHIWAEMGFAGAAAFLLGVYLLVRWLAGAVKASRGTGDSAFAAGLTGGIAAVLLHASVDSGLHEPGIVFLLILLAATAFGLMEDGRRKVCTLEIAPEKRARLTVMSVLLAVLLAAWAAKPALAYYFSGLGKDAVKAGRTSEALRMTEAALLLEPGNASYHDQSASLRYAAFVAGGGEDEFAGAVEGLDEAMRLNPLSKNYPAMEARLLMGRAAASKDAVSGRGFAVRALEMFGSAEKLDPYDAILQMDKSRVLLFLGRTEEAEGALKSLAGHEPNFLKGRLLLAEIYMATGRPGLAKDECYSIIKVRKALEGMPLDEPEKYFVDVDIRKVEGLIGGLGRGQG